MCEFLLQTVEWQTRTWTNVCVVSVACDGATVMPGTHGEVQELLKHKFPSIKVWHVPITDLKSLSVTP